MKTEVGVVKRGYGPKRGHLLPGFPDLTVLRRLPATPLCLVDLVEVRTATGHSNPPRYNGTLSWVPMASSLRSFGMRVPRRI